MCRLWWLSLLACVAAAGSAGAATTSSTFGVSVNLQSACSATAGDIAFGAYTPGRGARNANTTIRVKCTRNTAFTVSLNAGTTTGANLAQRLMASGPNTLQYNLYTNGARTIVFGDGTGATATRSGVGNGLGAARIVNVFGRLPDTAFNRAAVPGNYRDSITVTISY